VGRGAGSGGLCGRPGRRRVAADRAPRCDLTGRATAIPNELGGSSLTPGVYSSGVLTIDKTLTLNANHDPNAIFVFQSAATLEAGAGSRVKLINGASPCNVFWLVRSSATLETTADFSGNILALTDIHLRTGARVQGRALAETFNSASGHYEDNLVVFADLVPQGLSRRRAG
jgi:hypothetical protein